MNNIKTVSRGGCEINIHKGAPASYIGGRIQPKILRRRKAAFPKVIVSFCPPLSRCSQSFLSPVRLYLCCCCHLVVPQPPTHNPHALAPKRHSVPSTAGCGSQPTEAEQCGDEDPERHEDGEHQAAVVGCVRVRCPGPWLDPGLGTCRDLFLPAFLAGLTVLLFILLFIWLLQARVRLELWHICPVKKSVIGSLAKLYKNKSTNGFKAHGNAFTTKCCVSFLHPPIIVVKTQPKPPRNECGHE